MTTAVLLIALGSALRLLINFQVLDAPNAVPMAAIALYAGARLPRRWSWAIPLAILLGTDLIIDMRHGYQFFPASRLTTYALFAIMAYCASWAPKRIALPGRVLLAIAGSSLFFLVSNFAVWIGGEGFGYPMTFGGLLSNYAVAIPFYRNMLVADVLCTLMLFGALETLMATDPEPAASTVLNNH